MKEVIVSSRTCSVRIIKDGSVAVVHMWGDGPKGYVELVTIGFDELADGRLLDVGLYSRLSSHQMTHLLMAVAMAADFRARQRIQTLLQAAYT